jgi:transposase-like protein
LDKVKKADQEKVKKDLHRISHGRNRQAATQAYWSFCQKYREAYPGALKSLESDIDDLLSFYPVKLSGREKQRLNGQELQRAQLVLWLKIRTTNLIERAFREVKRRTRPMGVFVNRGSMERILYAVFFHYNSKGRGSPRSFLRRELDIGPFFRLLDIQTRFSYSYLTSKGVHFIIPDNLSPPAKIVAWHWRPQSLEGSRGKGRW